MGAKFRRIDHAGGAVERGCRKGLVAKSFERPRPPRAPGDVTSPEVIEAATAVSAACKGFKNRIGNNGIRHQRDSKRESDYRPHLPSTAAIKINSAKTPNAAAKLDRSDSTIKKRLKIEENIPPIARVNRRPHIQAAVASLTQRAVVAPRLPVRWRQSALAPRAGYERKHRPGFLGAAAGEPANVAGCWVITNDN
jgi:hypothetical protein